MNNTIIKKKDVKFLLDNAINLRNDKEKATEYLNKFGKYLNINDCEKYIKKIQKM